MTFIPNSPEARDVASQLHGYTNARAMEQTGPLMLTTGEGIYVKDNSGKQYLEAMSGLWCASLGFSQDRLVKAATDPETTMFVFLVILFTVMAVASGVKVFESLGWAISALATSGLPLGSADTWDLVPLPVFVLPALIGGSALSAAGGVKIARLIVLARRAGVEFRQLGYRRSVLGFQFRDREMDERSVIGVWVYLVAYILTVFLVMVGFAFTGLPFESSIRLAIGCLTNSGGLVAGHVAQLDNAASILAIFSMVLGRLEILAIIPAISVSFWRG